MHKSLAFFLLAGCSWCQSPELTPAASFDLGRIDSFAATPAGLLSRTPEAGSSSSMKVVDWSVFAPAGGAKDSLDSRYHTARQWPEPPHVAQPTPAQKAQPQFTREPLGTQTMDGIAVDSTRMTVVHPVNYLGNDRPMTTASESWLPSELRMMVSSKSSDPRFGDSTMELTNVSRAGPDPALFKIPADYKVAEQPAR